MGSGPLPGVMNEYRLNIDHCKRSARVGLKSKTGLRMVWDLLGVKSKSELSYILDLLFIYLCFRP